MVFLLNFFQWSFGDEGVTILFPGKGKVEGNWAWVVKIINNSKGYIGS